jgi:hypothetical protein
MLPSSLYHISPPPSFDAISLPPSFNAISLPPSFNAISLPPSFDAISPALSYSKYIDYLNGRCIKTDFSDLENADTTIYNQELVLVHSRKYCPMSVLLKKKYNKK